MSHTPPNQQPPDTEALRAKMVGLFADKIHRMGLHADDFGDDRPCYCTLKDALVQLMEQECATREQAAHLDEATKLRKFFSAHGAWELQGYIDERVAPLTPPPAPEGEKE